jgi:hypothetical protein
MENFEGRCNFREGIQTTIPNLYHLKGEYSGGECGVENKVRDVTGNEMFTCK